jgi:hypothetical protein
MTTKANVKTGCQYLYKKQITISCNIRNHYISFVLSEHFPSLLNYYYYYLFNNSSIHFSCCTISKLRVLRKLFVSNLKIPDCFFFTSNANIANMHLCTLHRVQI